tara:strand:+ start:6653 stop:7519 length:867 start_codon:yes stop_codon:yes gene_type:complete
MSHSTSSAYTVSYSEDSKGWPSFYSFLPDYMVGMNGFFYSWNKGNLYRHNTNTERNNYYGTFTASEITSVFNTKPLEIKLFKTMSYESNAAWECSSLFTDLSTGSMLATYFVQKEGEWFTFLRETSQVNINFKDRSANGIGKANTITGPTNAVVITFDSDTIGSILSVGDFIYAVTPVAPPGVTGQPSFSGYVSAIVRDKITSPTGVVTLPSITVNSDGPYPPLPAAPLPLPFPGTVPSVGDFILFIKDAIAESHGARGYFMHFTLKNSDTTAVELFSVGSSVMQSFP